MIRIFLLAIFPTTVHAGTLTLQSAFEQAAERNLHIEISRSSTRAASAAVTVTEGRFALHLASGVEVLQRSLDGESFGGQLRYSVQVTKLFSPGTRLSVAGVGSQVISRPSKLDNLINPPWQTDTFFYNEPSYGALSLVVVQPMLRGGGFDINEAPVRASQKMLQAARIQLEDTVAAQLRDVEIEYWRWAAAFRAVDTRRASLELARVQKRRTRELIRRGRQAASDALLADQIVADRRDALAVAESLTATRFERLYHLMGVPYSEMPTTTPGTPQDFPETKQEVASIDELLARIEHSYLPRRLALQQSALEDELAVNEDAAWPELNATLKLDVFGKEADLGSAYGSALSGSSHLWTGSVTFAYPLGVNPAAAEADRLRAELSKSRAALENATRQVQLAVVDARRKVILAHSRIEFAALAKRLANDKLRAEEERYAIGQTTMQNLRLFQEDLDEASLREIEAQVSYLAARAQLDYLVGTFLQERQLSLSPQ